MNYPEYITICGVKLNKQNINHGAFYKLFLKPIVIELFIYSDNSSYVSVEVVIDDEYHNLYFNSNIMYDDKFITIIEDVIFKYFSIPIEIRKWVDKKQKLLLLE